MGIIPLGTANDIARSINIPQDLQQAVHVIGQGNIASIDIGIVQPAQQVRPQAHQEGEAQTQCHGFFAHTVTVGLNVQFARLATNVATRQRYGKLTYPMAALEVLLNHEPLELDVRIEKLLLPAQNKKTASAQQREPIMLEDAVAFHCRALQAAVINAPIFGGQWNIALPNTSINDHLLDIIIVEAIELPDLMAAFRHFFNTSPSSATGEKAEYMQQSSLKAAGLTGIPGVYYVQAHGITISTNNDPQDITLDGEIRGQTPIHVHMADTALQVIVP